MDRSVKLNIEINSEKNGFIYIILHESAHAVDYVEKITALTEPYMKRFYEGGAFHHAFTAGTGPATMRPSRLFLQGGGLLLRHGKQSQGAHIRGPGALWHAGQEPLHLLYGTLNWAEDLPNF
jgi:hypothetical protein